MKKTNRKGFTIVELVIVIAVVAILAAVLIPTFVSLVRKANESNDISMVRNINTLLTSNGQPKNVDEAIDVILANGYAIENLTPTAEGNKIAWDETNNQLILLDKDNGIVFSTDENKAEEAMAAKTNVWLFINETSEIATDGYSYYLKGTDLTGELNVTAGISVGQNIGITKITYADTAAETVTFVTNGGELVIDNTTAGAKQNHYGVLSSLDVSTYTESYHEYGTPAAVVLRTGHIAFENTENAITELAIDAVADVKLSVPENMVIEKLTVNATADAAVSISNNGKIMSASATGNGTVAVNNSANAEFIVNYDSLSSVLGAYATAVSNYTADSLDAINSAIAGTVDGISVPIYSAVLNTDLTFGEGQYINVPAEKTFKLDLGGHTIISNDFENPAVKNYGTLEMIGGTVNTPYMDGIHNFGIITLDSCTVDAGGYAAMQIGTKGTATAIDCTMNGMGAAIYNGNKLTVDGGTYTYGNYNTGFGYALENEGEMIIKSGTVASSTLANNSINEIVKYMSPTSRLSNVESKPSAWDSTYNDYFYTIMETTEVACELTVNGTTTRYASLATAFALLEGTPEYNATLKLTEDAANLLFNTVWAPAGVHVYEGQELTLDLNGHTFTFGEYSFEIANGKMTVCDTSDAADGQLLSDDEETLFEVSGTGSLNITGGRFNFDVSAYVNTETHTVTNDGSVWTVTAK